MAPKAKSKQPKKPNPPKEDFKANANQPNWPHFHPLLPVVDLSLKTLLEEQVVIISNFWTATLCRTYVSFLSTLPLITTPGKPKNGDALRVNDRYEINDPDFAERLWSSTALKDLVLNDRASGNADSMPEEESMKLWGGVVVGLNPRIRIYRYRKGQFFGQHCTSTVWLLLNNNRFHRYQIHLWLSSLFFGLLMRMWSYVITSFSSSLWWADFTRAFIPAYITGSLAGFFLSWIVGQILLTCAVFMVNPSEGLLDVMDLYCYLFGAGARPMGPCLAPMVVFILHVLPDTIARVNTVPFTFEYVLQQAKFLKTNQKL